MKKYKKKTFLDSMKGTPIRQPSPLPVMNAEELVAESGGMLTLEAAEDFSVVQMRVADKIKSLQSQSCQIETVVLGNQFEIKPWYRGNYPAEYATLTRLHVCDGCFMYFRLKEVCLKHMRKCPLRGAPPGHEIYRDTHNNMSVFEVNGEKMPNYCANLCRLTMMWLGDKVVFADVEPFFFYILANSSEGFFKTLGYFSKQRNASFDQNLSCFCVFPCYQKMGLGNFLIDFSYLLSRLEFLPGGPERPLSALGAIAYKKYWRNTIITALYNKVNENGVDEIDLSLSDLSMRTGMREEDVAETIGILFKCKRVSKKAVTMFVNMGQLIAEGSKIVNLNRIMAVENYLNVDFLVEIRRRRAERLSELIGSPTRSSIKIL